MAKTIKMVSDMDTTMMEIERLDRVGHRLMVTGVMMGSFPTEIYVEPGDVLGMARLLRTSSLGFVLGFPYFWLRSQWSQSERRSLGENARGIVGFLALSLAALGALAVAALGTVELLRLMSSALGNLVAI